MFHTLTGSLRCYNTRACSTGATLAFHRESRGREPVYLGHLPSSADSIHSVEAGSLPPAVHARQVRLAVAPEEDEPAVAHSFHLCPECHR